MIDNLYPYPEMKPTSMSWLPTIPAHWEMRRNGRIFAIRKEVGYPNLPVLEVSLHTGVQVRSFENGTRKQQMTERSKYQRALKGDVAYNMMRMWQGAVGVAPTDGLISPAYVVVGPRHDVVPRYYAYLFRTAAYMHEVDIYSRGIVPDRNRLYWESFKRIPSVFPPPDEQQLIANFLDKHGLLTGKAIRLLQGRIRLLEEQHQLIVTRAVTRGIDQRVRFKTTGVPWLAEVPAHWEVMPLKRIAISWCDGPFGSGLKSSHYVDKGIRVIRLQNIGLGNFKGTETVFISDRHYKTLGNHDVTGNDLIVAGLGEDKYPAGRACVAPSDIGPAMVKADCFRFRLREGRSIPYFIALHLTSTALAASAVLSTGATRQRINLQMTSGRAVALPPKSEQLQILSFLAPYDRTFATAIEKAQHEIALIREFRARLISDVVTGKIDVRTAAASLPDAIEEMELKDGRDIEPDGGYSDDDDESELDEVAA